MASCDKNRLSPVQQKSKIPVPKATCLSSGSGKRSSSKDEASEKQRILRDTVEKHQNKRPSRIPIVVGRTNSENDKDKRFKNITSSTTKKPLGRDSGVNLSKTPGKRATTVKAPVNTPYAAKHGNVKKPTRPLRRRLPVTPLNAKQVSKDEKEPQDEKIKVQGDSVQSVDLSSMCKIIREEVKENNQSGQNSRRVSGANVVSVFGNVLEDARHDYAHLREEVELLKGSLDLCNHREELLRRQVDALEKELFDCKNSELTFKSDVKTEFQGSNGVCTCCEEGHKKELEQLEKEHSEIVEELQLWVEDGDQENKTLREIIEKTNEENAKLLVQISVMKKEMKALQLEKTPKMQQLEKENSAIVKELQQWVEDGDQENKTLREIIEKTNEENAKLLVQISVMKNEMKDLEKTPKIQQLEKENSAIIEELQQWVEDGDEENQTLREIIEKTNEENAKLLVQISVMKNEMKALQKKNDTLQTELETKRADLKRLKVNEHYMERELRNLKRDLKKKDKKLEGVEERMDNAVMEKQKLLYSVDYLEGSLKESQTNNELLNAQVDELKEMVNELNNRRDQGHLREELEHLKGSLDLCDHREKLLRFQVNALEAEASHFKTRELDYEEKLSEMNKLNDDKSEVVSHLEDQLDTFIKDNARIVKIISEKDQELTELQKENLSLEEQLKFQLTTLMNENDRIENEFENKLAKLKSENSDMKTEVSDKDERLAKLQKQVESLKEQNNLTQSKLDMAYYSLSYTGDKIEKLMKELEREKFDKDVLSMALGFSLDNCAIKQRVHARETRNLKNELAEMKKLREMTPETLAKKSCETLPFLVNENQFCMQLNGEKFFAM